MHASLVGTWVYIAPVGENGSALGHATVVIPGLRKCTSEFFDVSNLGGSALWHGR